MKLKYHLGIVILNLTACRSATDNAQESINSALEEVIENQTGEEVDLAKAGSFQNQKVEASFRFDSKEMILSNETYTGSVMAQRSSGELNLSFQLVDEKGTSLMGVFSNFDTDFTLPHEARFAVSNAKTEGVPAASLVFMKISEAGMEASPMPYEGTMTILKLNENIAEFQIDAKGGLPQDVEKPESWKSIQGKVSITSPVIQCLGLNREEIIK